MTKSLGQVAYEGWDSDVMTHTPWADIPAGFQAAWQAAAEAVKAELAPSYDTFLRDKRLSELERAEKGEGGR